MSLYQFDSPGKRRKKALSRQVASHVAVETLKAEANLGNVEARLTRLEMRFQEIETEGLSSIAKLGNNISSQMTLLSSCRAAPPWAGQVFLRRIHCLPSQPAEPACGGALEPGVF